MLAHSSADSNRQQATPAMLHALAGAPAGWRRARRGSFLVLVVGTLALLAVAAIIFATLGNQDVRTKAALVKREKLESVPDQFKDYVAGVIGDDRLATCYDTLVLAGSGVPGAYRSVLRETTDYPSIRWDVLSNNSRGAGYMFDPVGTFPAAGANPTPATFPAKWEPSDPWLASPEPTFLDFANAGDPNPATHFLKKRDWAMISNVAPDGRFVNLFALRNNFNATHAQLTTNLWLLDDNGAATQNTDFGAPASPDYPAHWTARQRGMFAPVGFNPGNYSWNQAQRPDYMYADADGDGMRDSRLFELVDGRDTAAGPISKLAGDPNYRWFFACRIVDLSGRINVNTAGDQSAAATIPAPIGLTPTDVDLLRTLTLADSYEIYSDGSNALGYNGVFNIPGPGDYTLYNANVAIASGVFAYDALRLSFPAGRVPDRAFDAGNVSFLGSNLLTNFPALAIAPSYTVPPGDQVREGEWNFLGDAGGSPLAPDPYYRWAHFQRQSHAIFGSVTDRFSRAPAQERDASFRFGLDDLAELLTYGRLNDDGTQSQLEIALDGRADVPNNVYGPLRSNRSPEMEKLDYTNPTQVTPGSDFFKTQLLASVDIRQRLTTLNSSVRMATQRVPLAPSTPGNASTPTTDRLGTSEVRTEASSLLKSLVTTGNYTTLPPIFRAYADALLPYSDLPTAWTAPEMRTLSYGYAGPELALHVAAHMSLNLADMYDADAGGNGVAPDPGAPNVMGQRSRARTLLVAKDFATNLNQDASQPDDQRLFPSWVPSAGAGTDVNLTLADARLAPAINQTHAPAANIYGVEAQPFLTQVTSLIVYTDTPGNITVRPGDSDEGAGKVTIDGTIPALGGNADAPVGASNHDLLMRVVAFKLTNPFDVPVQLSRPFQAGPAFANYFNATSPNYPELDRADDYYYVEYGGRYFKLSSFVEEDYVPDAAAANARLAQRRLAVIDSTKPGEFVPEPTDTTRAMITESGITINPGETVVCYALSQTPSRVLSRMREVSPAFASRLPDSKLRTTIVQVLKKNLGDQVNASQFFWVPEIDTPVVNQGTPSPAPVNTAGHAVLPRDGEYMEVVKPHAGSGRAVNLWRTVRVGSEATPSSVTLPGTYWDGSSSGATALQLPPRNSMSNDQLVDRLHLPGAADMLDRHLKTGQQEIDGIDPGDAPNYQDGLTIAFWETARRPADPLVTPNLPKGTLPGYCFEAKYRDDVVNPGGFKWNIPADDSLPNNLGATQLALTNFSRTEGEFSGPSSNSRGAAVTFADWTKWWPRNAVTGTVGETPDKITATPKFGTGAGPTDYGMADIPRTADYTHNRAEVVLDNARFERTRAALAGNTIEPTTNRVISTMRTADLLLPLGIGPSDVPINNANQPINAANYGALWADVRYTTLAEAMAAANGYERPGASAPPNAVATDVVFLYDPQLAGSTRRTPLDRGNLRLDEFTPFYDDNANGVYDGQSGEQRWGLELPPAIAVLDHLTVSPVGQDLLTAGTSGLINANTAPVEVLREVPLLSPPTSITANNTGQPAGWWWTGTGAMDESFDIAPTLVAYRDKETQYLRPKTRQVLGFDSVFFFDADPTDPGTHFPPTLSPNLRQGRRLSTQASLLSETPGLRTEGELLLARFRSTDPASPAWPCNADATAYDAPPNGQSNSRDGIDPIKYKQLTGPDLANQFREQLIVADAALPSLTSRSDTYAVWFLVEGFRKSDVTGLGPNDPLVPSVKRRFLMVLDRSNVTRLGEKPNILLFREVPVSADAEVE